MRSFRRPRHSNDPGSVYVVSAMNGLVKVGVSRRADARFGSLQCASPLPLTLAHVCEVTARAYLIEYEVHQRLAAVRAHGEWFRCSTTEAIRVLEEIAGPWKRDSEVDPDIAEWRRTNAARIDAGQRTAVGVSSSAAFRHNLVKGPQRT